MQNQISSDTLLQTARAYAAARPTSPDAAPKPAEVEAAAAAQRSNELTDEYGRHIKSLLTGWDFEQLDKEAAADRASKARLLGGRWKLYELYDAVSRPPGGSSEVDWVNHLEALKQWSAKEPNSPTPHIAMAMTYVNYAWHARGNGYANSVTNQEWQEYYQRINLAAASLMDAAKMKEKCPIWFATMQTVALAQGWDNQQARELFELASHFEPEFFTYYVKYAYYLMPKWYGAPGESEQFASDAAKRLGGLRGDLVYFDIAAQLVCDCTTNRPPMPDGLSWAKIQQGYEAGEHLFGVSNEELNEYALMAYAAGDKAAAQEAFAKIGDDWSQDTWWKQETFKDAKAWASGM